MALARLFSLILTSLLLTAAGAARADEPVSRHILALYDATREPDITESRLHRFAEMPLNHLGFVLHYRDVNTELPDCAGLAGYAGVVTWFAEPLRSPLPYLDWARDCVRLGQRYIVLGDPGADPNGPARVAVNGYLGLIGLSYTGDYVDPTYGSTVVATDKAVGFEHKLDPDLPPFSVAIRTAPDVTALIEIDTPPRLPRRRAVLAAVSPRGAYAALGYEFLHELPVVERGQWILDPFDFFRRALGGADNPIPDVTTVSGRRIYFSHVDGDGWHNLTTLENQFPARLSSQVMLDDLIAPYPDLPVTVGLIAGDVDPRIGGTAEAIDNARRIFALPQVEIGSHTYTHPFRWEFFAAYDRKRELNLVAQNDPQRGLSQYIRDLSSTIGIAHNHGDKSYVAGSADLPRAYMRDPFDLETEIAGSLDVANRLAPPGKTTAVLQWSGDTRPFEAAVKASRDAGIVNINGGDSRLDSTYPSVSYVPPVGRPVGRERQIYAVNSNENTYTDGWTADFAGQQQLTQTFENTELPRRLKGMNLYYHVYSAERRASLDVLKGFLDQARTARIAPITTSHYARMANGFYSTEITRIADAVWSIAGRGALETVRFDDAETKTLDLGRSRGVLGENRHAGSLYVALDAAEATPVVALRPAGAGGGSLAQRGPSLVESRWRVWSLERSDCDFRYQTQGFGSGDFVWSQLPPGRVFRVAARHAGKDAWTKNVTTDAEGKLSYSVEAKAYEPLDIVARCASQAGVE